MNESKVLVLFTVMLSPSTINREYIYYYKSTKDIFSFNYYERVSLVQW